MYLIKPEVQYWAQSDCHNHIAKCARICYDSKTDNIDNDFKLVKNLEKKNHYSMFRHFTHYFIVPRDIENFNKINNVLKYYKYCPYINYYYFNKNIFISCNGQFYLENKKIIDLIKNFEVNSQFFISIINDYNILRHTFCIVTQISTSRELNRVSPNNIAEQSTRYVNFGKKKGITICLPHWWDSANIFKKALFKIYWKCCELMYIFLLKIGFKPQDARGVLPLDTATKVVYTYTTTEWEHILDLRYFGKTGTPHPNTKVVAEKIYNELKNRKYIKI